MYISRIEDELVQRGVMSPSDYRSIVVTKREIPKINGSSGGFIALVVCLILIILISCAGILYLIHEEKSDDAQLGQNRRYLSSSHASSDRPYKTAPTTAFLALLNPTRWLPQLFARRSANHTRISSDHMAMKRGSERGWMKASSRDDWETDSVDDARHRGASPHRPGSGPSGVRSMMLARAMAESPLRTSSSTPEQVPAPARASSPSTSFSPPPSIAHPYQHPYSHPYAYPSASSSPAPPKTTSDTNLSSPSVRFDLRSGGGGGGGVGVGLGLGGLGGLFADPHPQPSHSLSFGSPSPSSSSLAAVATASLGPSGAGNGAGGGGGSARSVAGSPSPPPSFAIVRSTSPESMSTPMSMQQPPRPSSQSQYRDGERQQPPIEQERTLTPIPSAQSRAGMVNLDGEGHTFSTQAGLVMRTLQGGTKFVEGI